MEKIHPVKINTMHEIILYYKYIAIENPKALTDAQLALCQKLGLKGRIVVASEGINGTLEGTKGAIDEYCADLTSNPLFVGINIKRSGGDGKSFPKLKVKLRDEIVSAHLGDDDVKPWETTGTHLSAEELNKWIEEGKEFTIVDMRNDYEYKIGHFEGSVDMGMKNFRDLPNALSKIEGLKSKSAPIIPVCTGGVRCEKASGYLIKKGFKNVYQLENGIVTYIEKFPNKAFKGKLYVFDNRIAMDFDGPQNHTVVGTCHHCEGATERYVNCQNKKCNNHILLCGECEGEKGIFCSAVCREKVLVASRAV